MAHSTLAFHGEGGATTRVVPLGARLYRGSPRQCEKNFNPYEFYIINV